MLSFSLAIKGVLVIHQATHQLIFFEKNAAHPMDVSLFEDLQKATQNRTILLPERYNGQIITDYQEDYLAIWKGKYTYAILCLNHRPSHINLELLKSYGIQMESWYHNELEALYTTFQGNLDIFTQYRPERQNLVELTSDIFQLQYNQPFSCRAPTREFAAIEAELYRYAEEKVNSGGFFFLTEIIQNFTKENSLILLKIQDYLLKLIREGTFCPIADLE